MRVVFLSALLTLAACDQRPAVPSAPETAQQPVAGPSSLVRNPAKVEGWETSPEAYAKLGSIAPNFSMTPKGSGLAKTQDALRNRWTILGFPGSTESVDEQRFAGALKAAVDQDPDLDFLPVGDATVAETFAIDRTPAYLLIGPDLTIEAYRGALSATPEDGIKPVIRGVAEIKRQIAAPQ